MDRVGALLAEAPGLERASELAPDRLPVFEAFEQILPFQGLRPGTTVGVSGVGATSLALALIARASEESWTAAVGLPALGLRAGAELGIDLDRLVVVPDPQEQWTAVLASLVDAFDVVLAHPPEQTSRPHRLNARVREQGAVLVGIGRMDSDLTLHATNATWHGIGRGHGHLRTRTLDVTVAGRGAAAQPRHATLWLPDPDGNVSLAQHTSVIRLHR
ncbi:MAG TPA: hypothetical protein VFA34_06130 [Actinomycetota bacterium]|jgi:hypothetical protein|nr:hypothetical protein [Actinomycetota bacterium]